MLKKKIKFTDYNGVEREQTYYFNLSEAELTEMEFGITGGLSGMIEKIIETQEMPEMIRLWKDFILRSYGEKSNDGLRFIKSDELSTAFSQTEAYNKLYMELATDSKAAADFLNGIIPNKIMETAKQIKAAEK